MASKFGDFLAAYTNQIGARNTADYNRAKADQARMDVNKNKIANIFFDGLNKNSNGVNR